MSADEARVQIECPHCGHPIVTVPRNDPPRGTLVCPGCGARLEPPDQVDRLFARARRTMRRIFGGGRR